MFHVGQKVVCVDARARTQPDCKLIHGAVYTVACVRQHPYYGIILDLAEQPARVPNLYWADRFRPVVEKSTDSGMAILKEILERETVKDAVPVGNMTAKDVMALHDRTMAQLRAWVGR